MILFIILLVSFIFFYDYIIFIFTNFHNLFIYSFKDLYGFFKYKKYNNFNNYGRILLYSGSGTQVFGSGKTLSMIRDVINIYKLYNNKQVYDFEKGCFVTQKIHIISNVELFDVPYIKFEGVNQFIDIDKFNFGSMDICIYVLDESGAIFNSRQFRDNISTEFLTKLLQSRKNKCALFMTSQRLQFTDKILREICSCVIACRKKWRIVFNYEYNPLDLEYALNPEIVKPLLRRIWFATDKVFKSYNTYQLVDKINKNYNPNDFLTTKEILDTYGSNDGFKGNSTRIKRKYRD